MALQFNAVVLYYWWGGAARMDAIGALACRRFKALGKILPGAAAALGVWLQPQLPESLGFVIQAVRMLTSALLTLLGIVATFASENT